MGKYHKSALLILTNRTTLITTIDKLQGKTSAEIMQKTKKKDFLYQTRATAKPLNLIKEKSFLNTEITKLFNLITYITTPYTSQEKSTVENKNGVIKIFAEDN